MAQTYQISLIIKIKLYCASLVLVNPKFTPEYSPTAANKLCSSPFLESQSAAKD